MIVSNKRVQTIRLAPFSEKYISYFEKSKTASINVLEGAIRSGKTILNICAFCNYIENHASGGNFIASGISSGSAWEILAECRGHSTADGKYGAENGFGIMYMFSGRCKKTKVKHSDALLITNKRGKLCRVIFVGAKNNGSIEAIRGLTISGWIATELENHSTSEGNDFIGFMFGRLLGAPDGKMFFDLNPSYPTNKMYTNYLDYYGDKNSKGYRGDDYNYLKCGIFDNTAFTKEQVEQTLSLYKDKTSVMYQRDILGNRACAKGLIFGMFANNQEQWVVDDIYEFMRTRNPQFISIGVDFGGNGSNTTFVASLFFNNFNGILVLADDKIDMSSGESDSTEFRVRLQDFIAFVSGIGVAPIRYIYGDSADTVMCNEIKAVIRKLNMCDRVRVLGSVKGTILGRIKVKKSLLDTRRWFVYSGATNVISSTATQVWDSREGHEDDRLDNGSVDIDTADAEEYSWSGFIPRLIKKSI
jgi:hypothetical protein